LKNVDFFLLLCIRIDDALNQNLLFLLFVGVYLVNLVQKDLFLVHGLLLIMVYGFIFQFFMVRNFLFELFLLKSLNSELFLGFRVQVNLTCLFWSLQYLRI